VPNLTSAERLEEKGFLTVSGLVEYLKTYHPMISVSYPTMMSYIKKGYFKYIRVGGQYRIFKESIDHYVMYGTGRPISPGGLSPSDLISTHIPDVYAFETLKEKTMREGAEKLSLSYEHKQEAAPADETTDPELDEDEEPEFKRPPTNLVIPDIPEPHVTKLAKAIAPDPPPDDLDE